MHPNSTAKNYTRSELLYKVVDGLLNYVPLDETTRQTRYSNLKKEKTQHLQTYLIFPIIRCANVELKKV